MAKSILKVNTRPGQTYALIAVVLTTLLAVVASGLTALDDNTFEGFHQLTLVVMLVSYSTYIGLLWAARWRPVPKLEPILREEGLLVPGLKPNQIVTIRRPATPQQPASTVSDAPPALAGNPPLDSLGMSFKHAVRVVIVRDIPIDTELLHVLRAFPHVAVLDFQGCTVEPGAWQELVHLESLKTILAYGAVRESERMELHLTLPEIEIVLKPTQMVAIGQEPGSANAR